MNSELSASYLREYFEEILVSPEDYSNDKRAWRLAASLDRADVVQALLTSKYPQEILRHAHYWAAPGVMSMLGAFLSAISLSSSLDPSSSLITRRL